MSASLPGRVQLFQTPAPMSQPILSTVGLARRGRGGEHGDGEGLGRTFGGLLDNEERRRWASDREEDDRKLGSDLFELLAAPRRLEGRAVEDGRKSHAVHAGGGQLVGGGGLGQAGEK